MRNDTDKKWWNIHRKLYLKGEKNFAWSDDFVCAIKAHGLPEGMKPSYANKILRAMGLELRFRGNTQPEWSVTEVRQLRAISRLPLLRERGWLACMTMARRLGISVRKEAKE